MEQAEPQGIRDAQPGDTQLPRLQDDYLRIALDCVQRFTLRRPQVERDNRDGISLWLLDGHTGGDPIGNRRGVNFPLGALCRTL